VLTARPLFYQSGRVSIHGWAAGADSEAARLARYNPGARVALSLPCGDCRGFSHWRHNLVLSVRPCETLASLVPQEPIKSNINDEVYQAYIGNILPLICEDGMLPHGEALALVLFLMLSLVGSQATTGTMGRLPCATPSVCRRCQNASISENSLPRYDEPVVGVTRVSPEKRFVLPESSINFLVVALPAYVPIPREETVPVIAPWLTPRSRQSSWIRHGMTNTST
jgi:hypothetical protein